MKKLSHRAAVQFALDLTKRKDWPAAATAWLNAADTAGRYDEGSREMCNREAMAAFNVAHLPRELTMPGTSLEVFYWPMAREGEGKRGRTKGAAYMLCGSAMIGIEGVAGGIALSHVLVISETQKIEDVLGLPRHPLSGGGS